MRRCFGCRSGESEENGEDEIFGEVVEDELEGAVEGSFGLHYDDAGHCEQSSDAHESAYLYYLAL